MSPHLTSLPLNDPANMPMNLKAPLATLLAAITMLWCVAAQGASLTLQITDAAGLIGNDVVAYAEPASGQALPKSAHVAAQIEQKARRFAPIVTVIQTGSAVSFPNHDSVRHQVYSFSPAKVFELKLYSGAGGDPIVFDKAGTVIVGCNIHDQMAAYIQIVDTPWFGKSDALGKLIIDNLVPGKYHLKFWHPNLPTGAAPPEQLIAVGAGDMVLPIALTFKTQR